MDKTTKNVCSHCGHELCEENKRAKVFEQLPERGYIRQKLLIPHLVPFSNATLWRRVKAGEFPAPKKLSPRITAWRIEEVKAWLDSNPEPMRRSRR